MEFDYAIYPDESFIVFKFSGAVTLEFAKESYDQIVNDPEFDPNYDGLGDWRGITQTMNPGEATGLGKYVVENQLSSGRWAGIVDEPIVTALGTLYQSVVSQQHSLGLFSTLRGASSFLRRDVSKFLI